MADEALAYVASRVYAGDEAGAPHGTMLTLRPDDVEVPPLTRRGVRGDDPSPGHGAPV